MVWLGIDNQPQNIPRRLGILLGFAFLQGWSALRRMIQRMRFAGCSIGPLIATTIAIDPSILVSAFTSTCLVRLRVARNQLSRVRSRSLSL